MNYLLIILSFLLSFSAQAEDRLSHLYYFPEAGQVWGSTSFLSYRLEDEGQQNGNIYDLSSDNKSITQTIGVGVNQNLAFEFNLEHGLGGDSFIDLNGSGQKNDIDAEFEGIEGVSKFMFLRNDSGVLRRLGASISLKPASSSDHIRGKFGFSLNAAGNFTEETSWKVDLDYKNYRATNILKASDYFALGLTVQHFFTDDILVRGLFGFLGTTEHKYRTIDVVIEDDTNFAFGVQVGREYWDQRLLWLLSFAHTTGEGTYNETGISIDYDRTLNLFSTSLAYKF